MLPARSFAHRDRGFDPEDYEEEGGAAFMVFFAPDADLYGIGFGAGTWLKNAPVFGDYQLRTYYHGAERATYSGVGMTLRLMPRWTYAPYVGGGGNYNYSIVRNVHDDEETTYTRGDSYWSAHAETGLRIWMPQRSQFIEAAMRQTWNSGPEDYRLFIVSLGYGPMPSRRASR